ncbi:hypothetical protein IMZ31_19160 (plasmid) [Pontibacillus sp. ALD_SL1]|uniref:hypothetical protein n=1 Tax=Pontibacillus sp. ALD_SL1 TaxID=2777185 RepID=UPI001A97BBA5|nr:hypothetical protein [Pontibacillus sp. ALD_SL1]QST02670.1 hypothetical protein IMZ31_19160 [Pontibacillus sp. ALD_SL1]
MKTDEQKRKEIGTFLLNEKGYSKRDVIRDLLNEFQLLKGYEPDEIALMWDDEHLTDLETFTEAFYDSVIRVVLNVMESFEEPANKP